ncbi:MAG: hypothetical protein KA995_00060 [Paludibacteraceae bacterium]|nr:hypothetical protein [Paludibacteraceae bacterium]MBP8781156.1 hypothetical protein [Paludibacteraceae bacterium]
MRKIIFLFPFLFFSSIVFSQIAVGEWRMHFSYNSTTNVVVTPKKVYAIADNKLFSVDKKDFSIQTYSKLSGLNSNEVSLLAYDEISNLLIVVYTNSNIDIIDQKGGIYNIADLYRKNMTVSKKVNHIYFDQGLAYFSCDFGIMVLNLAKKEIANTYIIGDNATMSAVYAVNSDETYLYALTSESIKKAPKQGVNLLNFENWLVAMSLPDDSQLFRDMDVFNNKFYVAKNNENVYVYEEGQWLVFYANDAQLAISIQTIGNHFIINASNSMLCYTKDLTVEQLTDIVVSDSWYDDTEGVYWIASKTSALLRYKKGEGVLGRYKPSSPYLSTAQKMYYNNGRILVAPGKSWDDRYSIPGAVLLFEDEKWTEYTSENSGVLQYSYWFADVVSIAVDPVDKNKLYVSTWGEGVYVFENGVATQLFNGLNTGGVLETAVPSKHNFYRIDGLVFDKNKNLWMVNSLASKGLKMKTYDGKWHSFNYPSLANKFLLRHLLLHSRGQKWIVSSTSSGRGIFVIDDNGTILDESDDRTRFYTSFTDRDGNVIVPSYFYSIAEDKDGTVWLGTDKGPLLMTNVSKVFDNTYTCTRVKIPRNDGTILADYLLDNEEIRAIAIDAANRKWIGTGNSGVYLLSANGRETIHHFTVDNSPLSSNKIESIVIQEETGEVFFSTQDGLISYRSDATVGKKSFEKVEVFPNPIRPDFQGLITVRGLVANTEVRIVDQSGLLVFSGVATGGSIVWDGMNFANHPVGSGVYYVFSVNADGTEHGSTKFMIIR